MQISSVPFCSATISLWTENFFLVLWRSVCRFIHSLPSRPPTFVHIVKMKGRRWKIRRKVLFCLFMVIPCHAQSLVWQDSTRAYAGMHTQQSIAVYGVNFWTYNQSIWPNSQTETLIAQSDDCLQAIACSQHTQTHRNECEVAETERMSKLLYCGLWAKDNDMMNSQRNDFDKTDRTEQERQRDKWAKNANEEWRISVCKDEKLLPD